MLAAVRRLILRLARGMQRTAIRIDGGKVLPDDENARERNLVNGIWRVMIMKRFVPVAVVMLLGVITAIGFSDRNRTKEEQSAANIKGSVLAAIADADCDGSCHQAVAATSPISSCADCDASAQQCSSGQCCMQPKGASSLPVESGLSEESSEQTVRGTCEAGSCSTDEPTSDCLNGACAADQSTELLVAHGPPWARGQQAGRGKQGGGMGHGSGQAQMGCGMVLRNAINNGKIDEQLVHSLLFGPSGNAARGKQVFVKNCSVCHKLGQEGTEIAPDLTNRPRHNPVYLLANLSHPSAIIPHEYQVHVVVTDAGTVVTGFKVKETAKSITILDAKNQRTVIPRNEIEEVKLSEKSLMPENLIETLGEEQLRDLLSFLRS